MLWASSSVYSKACSAMAVCHGLGLFCSCEIFISRVSIQGWCHRIMWPRIKQWSERAKNIDLLLTNSLLHASVLFCMRHSGFSACRPLLKRCLVCFLCPALLGYTSSYSMAEPPALTWWFNSVTFISLNRTMETPSYTTTHSNYEKLDKRIQTEPYILLPSNRSTLVRPRLRPQLWDSWALALSHVHSLSPTVHSLLRHKSHLV